MTRTRRRRVAIDETYTARRALLPSERLRPVIMLGKGVSLGLEVVTFQVLP